MLTRSPKYRKSGGFSLAECVAAALILVSAMIVLTTLFHRAYQFFNKAEARVRAVNLAQSKLAEIRTDARNYGQFSTGLPTHASASSAVDGLEIETVVEATLTADIRSSPSTTLESAYPLAERKQYLSSFLKATVRVSLPGSDTPEVELQTLIGEPARTAQEIVLLSSIPGSGAGPFNLEIELRDSNGIKIPDVAFRWWVEPGSTWGTIRPLNRFASEVQFVNTILMRDGTFQASMPGGTVRLRATATYDGNVEDMTPIDVTI